MTKRLLIVEDEPIVALNYAAILRAAGICVVGPVPTAARALEIIEREPISGALLDVRLGQGSADPIAAELAARGVPFFFVSALSPEHVAAPFRNATFLSKPCRAETLIEAARAL